MSVLAWPKLETASRIVFESSPAVIAFSGGVDSTLVLKIALDAVGSRQVLAATGISPSIPPSEQAEAERIARTLGAPFVPIRTDEIENENYRTNPTNRCFFCKEELFTKLEELRTSRSYKAVLDGTNADDAKDWRPGVAAARKLKVRSPLLESGLTKDEIRAFAKHFELPNWDKPAVPCLSSRVPYGELITVERLDRIDRAEKAIRSHGFREVRVRDHFPIARIEVDVNELSRLIAEPLRSEIVAEVKSAGYSFVTIDLAGFRSGSLNAVKSGEVVSKPSSCHPRGSGDPIISTVMLDSHLRGNDT